MARFHEFSEQQAQQEAKRKRLHYRIGVAEIATYFGAGVVAGVHNAHGTSTTIDDVLIRAPLALSAVSTLTERTHAYLQRPLPRQGVARFEEPESAFVSNAGAVAKAVASSAVVVAAGYGLGNVIGSVWK